jgi:hypothetical protein
VVFADSVDVQSDLFGQFNFFEYLAQAISVADRDACIRVWLRFCEGGYADFHMSAIMTDRAC